MKKIIDPNQPIILGLAGAAATGKTSVAETLVPRAQINTISNGITWDHIFFALPLYEMASAKKNIRGLRERERQLYSLHSVIYDLFGGSPIGNVPDYDVLINIVKDIYSLPFNPEDIKPRSFLQKAGDVCREVDEDCFARWAIAKSHKLYREYIRNDSMYNESNPFCVIISDVRFVNEAQFILNQDNGILICFDASEEVRDSRILDRDGVHMTAEQKNHKSEQQIETIKEMASAIIDTDNLTIAQQTKETINIVNEMMGIYA
jgi:cytidylate kinase